MLMTGFPSRQCNYDVSCEVPIGFQCNSQKQMQDIAAVQVYEKGTSQIPVYK